MKGFSLIEIIVVIAILGIIASFGLIVRLDSYRKYMFHSEIQTMQSALRRARSQSMTNVDESPHGVCFDDSKKQFVAFGGSSYDTSFSPIFIDVNPLTAVASNPNTFLCSNGGIIFTQLSGTTSPIQITVTQNQGISTTTINYEGTIVW